MTAQLYCFAESGNAYKAALAMTLSGFDWEPVEVDFFGGEHRSPDYLALNPMGEVPLLVDGDLRLSQSAVILNHVAETTGQFRGSDPAETLRWLFWDNHKLSDQIAMARFLANFLPAEKRAPEVIDFYKRRLRASLKVLERHLDGRDWIVGNAPSIADLSCCGYLFYPEESGFTRSDWPHINDWLCRIQALPGWRHPYDLLPAPSLGRKEDQ